MSLAAGTCGQLAKNGAKGYAHESTTLSAVDHNGCDIVGLQETRRGGEAWIQTRGYTVSYSSGEKEGVLGVGLAVKTTVASVDDDAVEYFGLD